ncbi:MAG: SHOCT domain-containing protein [Dehalococcoidia bacterium]|nr:SHOCT domain-containing protein [Dehalococcoidia bacterium]
MGGFGMAGIGGFGMLFGMGFYLLFLVGLIGLAVWGVGQFARVKVPICSTRTSNAIEILLIRYARGEITRAEYDRMIAHLS